MYKLGIASHGLCRERKKEGKERYFSWNLEITLDNTLRLIFILPLSLSLFPAWNLKLGWV